jgi:hypothetical protein
MNLNAIFPLNAHDKQFYWFNGWTTGVTEFFLNNLAKIFLTAFRYGLFIQMPTIGFTTRNQLSRSMVMLNINIITLDSVSIFVIFSAIISTKATIEVR